MGVEKRAAAFFVAMILLLAGHSAAFAAWSATTGGDHHGQDWTVSSGSTIGGFHYNIGAFTLQAGTTAEVVAQKPLRIRAETIDISGTLDAEGKGHAGGKGGSGSYRLANGGEAGSPGFAAGEYGDSAGSAGIMGNDSAGNFRCYFDDYCCDWDGWCRDYCCDKDSSYEGHFCGGGGAGGGGGGGNGQEGCDGQNGFDGSGSFCSIGAGGNGGSGGDSVDSSIFAMGAGGGGAGGGGAGYNGGAEDGNSGGNGGGLVILEALVSYSQSGVILANGNQGEDGGDAGTAYTSKDWTCEDNSCQTVYYQGGEGGKGGGGAGGTVVISSPSIQVSGSESIEAKGGMGADDSYGAESGAGGAGRIVFFRDSGDYSCGSGGDCVSLDGCGGASATVETNNHAEISFHAETTSGTNLGFVKMTVESVEHSIVGNPSNVDVSMIPGIEYFIHADLWQGSGSGYYRLKLWKDASGSTLSQDNTLIYAPSGAESITLVFEQVDYYLWTAAFDADFDDKKNWNIVVGGSAAAAPSNPSDITSVVIPSGTTDVKIKNNSKCKEFVLESGATAYYDNTTVRMTVGSSSNDGTMQIAGIFIPDSNTANPDSRLYVNGDLELSSSGRANLTEVRTWVKGDIHLASNSQLYKESSDNDSEFDLEGDADVFVRNDAAKFVLPRFAVDKSSRNRKVRLYSNLGPLPGVVTDQHIGFIKLEDGAIDANGHMLAANYQACAIGNGQFDLARNEFTFSPSELRVLAESTSFTPCYSSDKYPFYLRNGDRSFRAVDGYGAFIQVGPYDGPGIAVSGNTRGFYSRSRSWIDMKEGGRILLDNLRDDSGWELLLSNGSKTTLDRTWIESDGRFWVNYVNRLQTAGSTFRAGYGIGDEGSQFVTKGSYSYFNGGNTIDVNGSVWIRDGFRGDYTGDRLIIRGENRWFKSRGRFDELIIDGSVDIVTSIDIGGGITDTNLNTPTIERRLLIDSGAELHLPAEVDQWSSYGSLRLGRSYVAGGAKVDVLGSLVAIGSEANPVRLTRGNSNAFYEIRTYGGRIVSQFASFDYLGPWGITIDSSGFVGDVAGDYDFDNCRFRRGLDDYLDRSVMLRVDNDQNFYVDDARMIGDNDGSDRRNIQKTLDQGTIIFQNEECTVADSDCTNDLSGEARDIDEYGRINWNIAPPVLAECESVSAPLNSGKSRVHLRISQTTDFTGMRYCFWDRGSSRFVVDTADGPALPNEPCNFVSDQISECCEWHDFDYWGGTDGIDLMVEQGRWYDLQLVGTSDGSPNPTFYMASNDWCGIWETQDTESPTVPEAASVDTVSGTGEEHLSLDWGDSSDSGSVSGWFCWLPSDCPAGLDSDCRFFDGRKFCVSDNGSTCRNDDDCWWQTERCKDTGGGVKQCLRDIDFILLRGTGEANGSMDSLPADSSPPDVFRPVNGEADDFSQSTDFGVWENSVRSPGYAWTLEDEKLLGNCPGDECRISFDLNGAEYDFSDGYIMSFDAKKTALSTDDGFELVFKFQNQFARWVIGEYDGGQHWSRIYYMAEPGWWSYPMAVDLGVDKWHHISVHVKGSVARGYIDGFKKWEIWFDSITGDQIALAGGTEGFRLVDSSAQFDNFMIAPFLYDGEEPANSWIDELATDSHGPMTPHLGNEHVTLVGTEIQLSINAPSDNRNIAGLRDRATPYYYYVMAVDEFGNVSNIAANPGFENPDMSVWQEAADGIGRTNADWIEGYYSATVSVPPNPGEVARQNVSYNVDTGSILRFSRYFKTESYVDGGLYPATIEPISPALSSVNGTLVSNADLDWSRAVNHYPENGALSQGLSQFAVYSKPEDGSSYELLLDRNRIDVVTGNSVVDGYGQTQVEYLVFEGGDVCNDAEFALLGAYAHESDQAQITVSDTSLFLENRLRTYRMRSCDVNGNCGPWLGGVSCIDDADCSGIVKGGRPFTSCKDFDGAKYCARADGCLPGVEFFTPSAIPPAPVANELTEVEAQTLGVAWSESFRLEWDGGFTNNRAGSEFLIVSWSSTSPGTCGEGAQEGYVADDGTIVSAYSDGLWNVSRSRVVTGLATNKYHCFRTMARNGDFISTGDVSGAGDWAGWSELSNVALPPARPEMIVGSFNLKYGIQDSDSQQRAMIVDGQTAQELRFSVTDDNNFPGEYNDIRSIRIRISPHADFLHAGNMQRGYFRADYDPDARTWSFFENTQDFGNGRVALNEELCSVSWNGSGLDVFVSWSLNIEDLTSSYVTSQDQGIQISISDSQGHVSGFTENRMKECDEVFHTSYLTALPVQQLIPYDNAWSNAGKSGEEATQSFIVMGNIDRDYQYQTDLYQHCMTGGYCEDWDLDDKADWYNCIDDPASVGDQGYYKITVHTAIDGEGHCTEESLVAPAVPQWDACEIMYDEGLDFEFYRVAKEIDLTVLAEGMYYWCVQVRDQHHYAPTGSGDTEYTVFANEGNNRFGIDRIDPVIEGFEVFSFDAESGEDIVTDKDGQWIFTPRVKFKWNASPVNLDVESPISKYRYLLMKGSTPENRIEPFDYHGGDSDILMVEIEDDGVSAAYNADFYNNSPIYPGQHQFGLQVMDRAGNLSETTWFDLKVESKVVDGPCISSDTHPDQLQIYCNFPNAEGGDIVWNDDVETAPKPIFDFIDPVMGNQDDFSAKGSMCCTVSDPDTGACNYRMSGSGIQAYSFTISESNSVSPDDDPEDDNSGNCGTGGDICEQVCPADGTCRDSDQCNCDTDDDCGQGQVCVDGCYCCGSVSCDNEVMNFNFIAGTQDANNIYHSIQYFISRGFNQLSGTFYLQMKGWTVAGVTTQTRSYRINVCGCDPGPSGDPCKDASLSARKGAAMSFFEGGSFNIQGASGKSEVSVEPFHLDRTEVSIADYVDCVADEVCPAIEGGGSDSMNDPATKVSWDMAQTYCRWAGKRLPTENEWLFAANRLLEADNQGLDAEFDNPIEEGVASNVNRNLDPGMDGRIFNLLTNASEWLSDWWMDEKGIGEDSMKYGPERVETCMLDCRTALDDKGQSLEKEACESRCRRKLVRGGSFLMERIDADRRDALDPESSRKDVGFRCAKSALREQEELTEMLSGENDGVYLEVIDLRR